MNLYQTTKIRKDRIMYKISVPIRNATVTRENRHQYLELLRRSKAERIFLIRSTFCRTPQEWSR